MGAPQKKVTEKMKVKSIEISENLLHADWWYRLFDAYELYVSGGGKEPKIIRLFERSIEEGFSKGTEHGLEAQTLNLILEDLSKTNDWKKQVKILDAFSSKRRSVKTDKSLALMIKRKSEYSGPFKMAPGTSIKKYGLPQGSVVALRNLSGKLKKEKRAITTNEKKKIREIVDRNTVQVKEEKFIFEVILNTSYSKTFKFFGDEENRLDLCQKAYENLLVGGVYDVTASRGQKINYIKMCLKTAWDAIRKSENARQRIKEKAERLNAPLLKSRSN